MLFRALTGNLQKRNSQGFVIPSRDIWPQPLTGPVDIDEAATVSTAAAFRCVQLISLTGAALDIFAYRRNDQLYKQPRILAQPDPAESRIETISSMITSLLIHGNMFAIVTARDSLGFAESLVVLNPEAVSVRQENGRIFYAVNGVDVDSGDMVHAKGLTFPGAIMGSGPLQLLKQTFALATAGETYAGEAYVNGAIPSGLLHSEQEISQEEADALKQGWISSHGGRQRSPAVISGGVKYTPLSFSSADLELVDSRSYSAQQICTAFGVPGFLVGVETGDSKTYSSVSQDSELFHRYTLKSWLSIIEQAFSQLLPRGQHARFDLEGLLRTSTAERYAAYKTAIDAGFLTIDEVRRREHLDPEPDRIIDDLEEDVEEDVEEQFEEVFE